MKKAITATLINGFTFLVDFGPESKIDEWIQYYGNKAISVDAHNMNKRFRAAEIKYDNTAYDLFGSISFAALETKEKLSVCEYVGESM